MFRWELTAGAVAELALLAGLWATAGLGVPGLLTGTTYALVSWAVLSVAFRRPRTGRFGPANAVTLVRVVLIAAVVALAADHLGRPSPAALSAIAAVALVLDTVDGRVARATGTSSELGGRFDIEADALLVLVLSVFAAALLGSWVVAIGCLRYVFVAASWVAPWLRGPLPPSQARKVVGVFQGIALLVAASGLLPRSASVAVVVLAFTSLVWSFGRDVVRLWQHRTRRTSPQRRRRAQA
ncbi:CDP-alcohol phosphatidyltransferase family protein [Actinopolymorpha sp. NPDC004070]|uniref:CDP-alcohol phosphatidyltransferase family protein n=1 Tax=Actinopolymorpha sp. NPDC004070 TaxID=3154548 RepID=UPI0033A6B652